MWRDDRIQVAIDTTSGFIAAKLAERMQRPIHEMERLFLASKTYRLLCDPETGLYADNVLETADLFLREIEPALFPKDEQKPQSYFKYRSLRDPRTKEIFEKRELWYSAPKDFNDPFDCNLQMNSDGSSDSEIIDFMTNGASRRERTLSTNELNLALEKVKSGQTAVLFSKWREEDFRDSSICCFSHLGDSIRMFSYYADGHKGICIEFSFSVFDMPTGISLARQVFGKGGKFIAIDVAYQEEFPELNYLRLEGEARVLNVIGVKAKKWKYEEEFRIFRHQMPAGAVPFAPNILKRVILGAKTNGDEMALVKGWLKDWPTPVVLSKADADAESFKLNIHDVEMVGGAH